MHLRVHVGEARDRASRVEIKPAVSKERRKGRAYGIAGHRQAYGE